MDEVMYESTALPEQDKLLNEAKLCGMKVEQLLQQQDRTMTFAVYGKHNALKRLCETHGKCESCIRFLSEEIEKIVEKIAPICKARYSGATHDGNGDGKAWELFDCWNRDDAAQAMKLLAGDAYDVKYVEIRSSEHSGVGHYVAVAHKEVDDWSKFYTILKDSSGMQVGAIVPGEGGTDSKGRQYVSYWCLRFDPTSRFARLHEALNMPGFHDKDMAMKYFKSLKGAVKAAKE